jgi:hypothetical protein
MKRLVLALAVCSFLSAGAFAGYDHPDGDKKDKPHITGDAMTAPGFAAAAVVVVGSYFVLRRRTTKRTST